ncbi:MAG: MBL fold metallo-hydrolase [Promethearchaeia archaeon]
MNHNVTILVDNLNGTQSGFVKSYGFAVLIEKNDQQILFDVGTKVHALMKNLKVLGTGATELDAIILSHNHYDHTDGLPGILNENPNIPIYIHKDWNKPASFKGVLVPKPNRKVVKRARELKDVCKGIYITDSFLSPDYGGVYEQAIYVEGNDQCILICGCCHPGLNVFIEEREKLGISLMKELTIMGGFHGFSFSDKRAEELDSIIRKVYLCHCTQKTDTFKSQFGEKCEFGMVGRKMSF